MKKILKGFLILFGLISFGTIFLSSLSTLYENRSKIKTVIGARLDKYINHDEHGPRYLVNPLKMSKRQAPPDNIEDLKISNDAQINGQWSAPFDWNVTAIHSVLLPNESVMTFGSFGVIKKEKKDTRMNKEITISDGRTLERDRGLYQWHAHDVNSGVDFDIWNINKGFQDNAHTFYNQPIVMDSFCSVVRVLDEENVFIVGGNKNIDTDIPDTQAATMIFNIKDGSFKRGKDLKYKRWYGSVVRTGDEKLIILGGEDIVSEEKSITPEIIDLNNLSQGWRTLQKASSKDLFGDEIYDEWNYPRSYLSSDGNIVGISYNKIWVMNKDDDYRINKTGEIPLAQGAISRLLVHEDLNHNNHSEHNHQDNNVQKLRLLTMGAPVGSENSTVMIGKDKVYVFGGKQNGDGYTSSNKVYKIDFLNSFKPKIEEMNNMSFPRANANATLLPTGEVFLNGGQAYNDNEFSIFTPEIYNVATQESKTLSQGYFRRNYHSSSILLPNGTILVSGGDVWNSEIFYPPYLFTKDWNDNTVLAKRPKIINLENKITRGQVFLEVDEKSFKDIQNISIISTGSTTHAQSSEPKFRFLEFSKSGQNKFLLDIPINKNELANGTYMIFVINSMGVPSKGKIIYLN